MAIDSDIRDQAYQFFIQEAPELLQVIEAELLTLRQERSTAKVHNMMRAAHSIKGGAASVGLETIKILAHSVEDIFKALHHEALEIDVELDSLLLRAYDCLRLPLMEQITTGEFDSEQAMANAEPVFAQIEERLGDFLGGAADLPSSIDLGVDIALSIFEVDVAQGLDRLTTVLENSHSTDVGAELRAQAEVFAGIAELLSLPGFGAIASTALAALSANPAQAIQITQLAVADFQAARTEVINGDRTKGGEPGAALTKFVTAGSREEHKAVEFRSLEPIIQELENVETLPENVETLPENVETRHVASLQHAVDPTVTSIDDIFGGLVSTQSAGSEPSLPLTVSESDPETQELYSISIENVFDPDNIPELVEQAPTAIAGTTALEEFTAMPSLDILFGDLSLTEQPATSESLLPLEVTPTVVPPQELHSLSIETVFDPDFARDKISEVVEQASAANTATTAEQEVSAIPTLDALFGDLSLTEQPATPKYLPPLEATPHSAPSQALHPDAAKVSNKHQNIKELVQSIEQTFESLPPIQSLSPATPATPATQRSPKKAPATEKAPTAQLSVRVDIDRLERMNNLVGELSINRNSLSLKSEQLQGTIKELLRRFAKFQQMGHQLRDFSDQLVVDTERRSPGRGREGERGKISPTPQRQFAYVGEHSLATGSSPLPNASLLMSGNPRSALAPPHSPLLDDFDSLEMDSYSELHSLVQATLEEMVQLEEKVGDLVIVAGQSNQSLEEQRQMLGHLRDDLMWARMLPIGEVLNRFPRILRDLSNSYHKPVDLKLTGTGVLVDKAAIEKLYDPLLHLLRNAFDHGIETPEARQQQGKPAQGNIEIRAYHQGSQTIIEIKDDGRGINREKIRSRALEKGLMSPEQAAAASEAQLIEVLFEPGFSTAAQVSELSGRGVGLDVVRSQLRSLKGNVTITSQFGRGTVFTLRIPLTLTIAKLLVGFVGSRVFAFPSDSIAEILIPQPEQVKQAGGQRFLHWQDQIVPTYHLSQILQYGYPLPEPEPSQALVAVPTPDDWAPPMLLLEQDKRILAIEIDRLVTEQELVIKPFGAAIASPSYIYGCTILGDGHLIPVFDAAGLLHSFMGDTSASPGASTTPIKILAELNEDSSDSTTTALPFQRGDVPTVLVVDDSITVRQTLVLTLQKADYRVLQARDGKEAISQLQQNPHIQLVICDIEMPNMNGFEFLSHRRQDPVLAKIPTVMLTSRSSDKHRQLAMHLGAKSYFTKPYIEQDFLAQLKDMIILQKDGKLV